VRVRFAPSPSGDLHVGNIRTALYDWAYARHTGGTFIFRIEDTDRARVTDEYIHAAIESLRWLGLQWDEGPEVGGPYGPYQQSQRQEIYADWVRRFVDEGHAYRCYATPEELEALREEQKSRGVPPGYDNRGRYLTREQIAAYEAEGRKPAIRFRVQEGRTVVRDMIRGDVTFEHATIPDFVLLRADGYPLYNLAVSIDDVLMKVTHIVRGDDLLASTPRQMAVYAAMGVEPADFPEFAHLPYVLGHDGQPLSKRHGSVSVGWYRQHGFLPEALVNYLALLGWSPGEDREEFTLEEMARDFTLERVNRNAARFDVKKLEAVNGAKIRALAPDRVADRILPFLETAGLVANPATDAERELVNRAAPLIQERVVHLTEAVDLLGFLFVDEHHFAVEPEAASRSLTEDSGPTLEAAQAALEEVAAWTTADIETALRKSLVDGLGLKPKHAFGPVRVAATGRRVSPPLFESLELLGRERSMRRIRRALEEIGAGGSPQGA
jgi:glutamyl-tRNA synthetase